MMVMNGDDGGKVGQTGANKQKIKKCKRLEKKEARNKMWARGKTPSFQKSKYLIMFLAQSKFNEKICKPIQ